MESRAGRAGGVWGRARQNSGEGVSDSLLHSLDRMLSVEIDSEGKVNFCLALHFAIPSFSPDNQR